MTDKKYLIKLTSRMCKITSKRITISLAVAIKEEKSTTKLKLALFHWNRLIIVVSQSYLNYRKYSKRQHKLILITQINCFSFHLAVSFARTPFISSSKWNSNDALCVCVCVSKLHKFSSSPRLRWLLANKLESW